MQATAITLHKKTEQVVFRAGSGPPLVWFGLCGEPDPVPVLSSSTAEPAAGDPGPGATRR